MLDSEPRPWLIEVNFPPTSSKSKPLPFRLGNRNRRYDVMLDSELRPWLIEVNHSPSFNIDSPLDLAIKEELITHTIQLVRVHTEL